MDSLQVQHQVQHLHRPPSEHGVDRVASHHGELHADADEPAAVTQRSGGETAMLRAGW